MGDEELEILSEEELRKAGAEDLDLPESDEGEDEEERKDLQGAEETDSEMEEYYKELGIAEEVDYSKKAGDKLYKKEKKGDIQG